MAYRRRLLVVLLLLPLAACSSRDSSPGGASAVVSCVGDVAKAQQPRTVGIVPQLPPAEVFKRWRPVLQALGERSGVCFELVVPASIPRFERDLQQGRFDYAFMNPYHQVMVQQRYEPLVRDSDSLLRGILLVRRDSSIETLQQLNGSTIAFPSPNAFAASLLIRAHLQQLGIAFTPLYLKTHSNVYRAVAIGQVEAGGGVNNTLSREPVELRDQLRTLYTTPGYPAHPFSVLRGLDPSEARRVQQAWLTLSTDKAAVLPLHQVQMPAPVASRFGRDYQPLQQLKLDRLVSSASGGG